jgi:rsbT co-antagonist protein RsbR
MTPITEAAKYLIDNAENIAVEIVETVILVMELDIPEIEKEQAITMYVEFLNFLGESFAENIDGIPEGVIIWSRANALAQASIGGRISCIVARYQPTREIFADMLTRISSYHNVSMEDNAFMLKRVNLMLDISLNETVLVFEKLNDEATKESKKQITELSAPILPILEGVAVMPLVGTIDFDRAKYILEQVPLKVKEQNVHSLISDFSGIYTLDATVINFLFETSAVLGLLGVHSIVTGVRPEVAQCVVQLGMDLSLIKIFGTVQQALREFGVNG